MLDDDNFLTRVWSDDARCCCGLRCPDTSARIPSVSSHRQVRPFDEHRNSRKCGEQQSTPYVDGDSAPFLYTVSAIFELRANLWQLSPTPHKLKQIQVSSNTAAILPQNRQNASRGHSSGMAIEAKRQVGKYSICGTR